MLKLMSRGFEDLTLHNTAVLDTWWNMLIQFSKEIGKSCENN